MPRDSADIRMEQPPAARRNMEASPPAEPSDPEANPTTGDIVESDAYTYELADLLGKGGYGSVYEADATKKDDNAKLKVALKVEQKARQTLLLEAQVLREATARKCKRIPRIYDAGAFRSRPYNFIAMELKWRDLYNQRKTRQNSKFSLATAIRVGMQTLEAIEELHDLGYINRDIKPGNFVIGQRADASDLRNVYLIDFGLAKKYMDPAGRIVQSRGEIGWRGTNRYGSLKAHLRQDLGRRDDLESWFYSLVELTKGTLPWATKHDREAIHEMKKAARINVEQFLEGCPGEYKGLLTSIDALEFSDAPNYSQMREILEQILATRNIDIAATTVDWEQVLEPAGHTADGGFSSTRSPTTQLQMYI